MLYELVEKKHLPQLGKLYADSFNSPPWNESWSVDTVVRRLTPMLNCDGFYGLVCLNDDHEICGMILGNDELFYDCMHFNIKEFCISPYEQGKGLGATMLKKFEKQLIKKGIDEIYLFTSRANGTEKFYHNCGYETYESMVMMGKKFKITK